MNSDPILHFRSRNDLQQPSNTVVTYSIKSGIHEAPDSSFQPDLQRFGQNTMLTETREAVDSSEHS